MKLVCSLGIHKWQGYFGSNKVDCVYCGKVKQEATMSTKYDGHGGFCPIIGGEWICPRCKTNNSGGLMKCKKCSRKRK